jgi:hypothetical protein
MQKKVGISSVSLRVTDTNAKLVDEGNGHGKTIIAEEDLCTYPKIQRIQNIWYAHLRLLKSGGEI